LWASLGTDAWYLGPSAEHYRCNLYYVPETRTYRISGSAELFPQHCQVSNLSNNAHLKALTKELETLTGVADKTHKGRMLIKVLGKAIKAIHPKSTLYERLLIEEDIAVRRTANGLGESFFVFFLVNC